MFLVLMFALRVSVEAEAWASYSLATKSNAWSVRGLTAPRVARRRHGLAVSADRVSRRPVIDILACDHQP